MTRVIRNRSTLQLPAPDTAPLPYRVAADDVDDMNPTDVRKRAPYQRGDVLLVAFDKGIATKVCVLNVGTEYLQRRGEWIPSYTVAFLTKSGAWSKQWRRAYPGPIERGYEAAAATNAATVNAHAVG